MGNELGNGISSVCISAMVPLTEINVIWFSHQVVFLVVCVSVAEDIYSSIVFRYNCEVFNLSISISCHVLLLYH